MLLSGFWTEGAFAEAPGWSGSRILGHFPNNHDVSGASFPGSRSVTVASPVVVGPSSTTSSAGTSGPFLVGPLLLAKGTLESAEAVSPPGTALVIAASTSNGTQAVAVIPSQAIEPPPLPSVAFSSSSSGGLPPSDWPPVVPLPDQASLQVLGTFDSLHLARMFQIPIDANSAALELQFRAPGKNGGVEYQITVLDPNGRELARTIKGFGPLQMLLNLADARAQGDSLLYVEVSAAPTVSDATTPFAITWPVDFSLGLTREAMAVFGTSNTEQPFAPGLTLPGTAPSDRSPFSPLAGNGGAPMESAAQDGAQPPAVGNPLEYRPLVVGPLPTRGIAPLGGLLADGDPAPQVDRDDAVLVDLELIGLSALERVGEPARAEPGPAPAERTSGLVTVRGPGGFPLLASALMASPHGKGSTEILPIIVEAEGQAAAAAEPVAIRTPEVSAKPSRRRMSLMTGTGLALATVIGLMMPDLVQTLQFQPERRFRLNLRALFARRNAPR